MTFRPTYALATALILAIELYIGLYIHDQVIRPYVGDGLAVVLVYLGLRAVTTLTIRTALLAAVAIAFAIEFGQYFHLIDRLGLRHNRVARLVLGTTFDVGDLVCYVAGAAVTGLIESVRSRGSVFSSPRRDHGGHRE
jgi:hypothetical protein